MNPTHLDESDITDAHILRPAAAGGAVPQTQTDPIRLGPGDAITQWLFTDPEIESFKGTARPNPDNVDYVFGLTGADTGQSPARERLETRAAVSDTSAPHGAFRNVYCEAASPNVDFSVFAYVPLKIRRALRCRLHTERGGTVRFRIAVCGRLRLWVGDELVEDFAPFSGNSESRKDIALDLPAGASELIVELENIFERNTVNFFSLTYLSGVALGTSLPCADPLRLADAVAVMRGIDVDRVYYEDGPLRLGLDPAPQFGLTLDVREIGQAARNHCYEWLEHGRVSLTLTPGDSAAALPEIAPLPTGCSELWIGARVGALEIRKRLGTTILTRSMPLRGADIPARKREVLAAAVADTGAEISVALVHLSQGQCNPQTERILNEALRLIEERHDCSDFAMLVALRIWRDYLGLLPDDLGARLRRAILGYRYWMSEPGADAMWFWSENHVLCFHIAQYVAGHMFVGEVFANSGRLGETHAAEARQRLYRWFDAIGRDGLCEWNSAAYYPIDMLALFSLHDLSPDPRLREKAARLLDQIFVMTALHASGGTSAGTQGRSYEKELLPGPASELAVVAAIAFGGTYYPGQGRAAFSFCLSDYTPLESAAPLVRPDGDSVIEAEYCQGVGGIGKLTLWKNRHGQLSTVADHMTGMPGAQQHVVDVQFAAHPMARLWINHPGDRKPWSERRPSRLAGNHWLPRVAQHRNRAFLIYDIPEDERYIPYTQLFAISQAFDEASFFENGAVFRSGAYCASIQCSEPLEIEQSGAYRQSIFRARGRKSAWAITLHAAGTGPAGEDLRAVFAPGALHFDRERLTLCHAGYELEHGSGRFVHDGTPVRQRHDTNIPHIAINGGDMTPWTQMG